MEQKIILSFDGALAGNHELDMRQLGESLIGFHRLLTVGLFVLETGVHPKNNQSLTFSVIASEPRKGSFEVWITLGPALATLPIVHELFLNTASDILYQWICGALKKMAGREQEADVHFSKLIDLMDSIDARRHLEVIHWQSLWGAACKGVASIGHL